VTDGKSTNKDDEGCADVEVLLPTQLTHLALLFWMTSFYHIQAWSASPVWFPNRAASQFGLTGRGSTRINADSATGSLAKPGS
jgi:hypothetical protein